MRLLKIIVFFFIIYFIRRFFQFYGAMKKLQEAQAFNAQKQQAESQKMNGDVIEADFKVVK